MKCPLLQPIARWYAECVGDVEVFALERKNCPIVMHWLMREKAN